ncbi:hypothetical protein EMIT043CA1_20128 [Pseudomonas brassicacearum]
MSATGLSKDALHIYLGMAVYLGGKRGQTLIAHSVQWRLCVGDLRVCRVPVSPVSQPAHSCHPFA